MCELPDGADGGGSQGDGRGVLGGPAGWCGVSDYAGQVLEYLAYCKWAGAWLEARGSSLDPKYHPTADGAVKMIPHGGDATRAREIRAAFREATADG